MRLDKYLKVSRLIKRRELAKEFIEHGFVSVNEKDCKPSTEIKIGDKITITSPSKRKLSVLVKEIRMVSKIDDASLKYDILGDTEDEN